MSTVFSSSPTYERTYIQNMNAHGCLFCTFGANRKAYCEFRDIGGVIMDRFEMESLEDPTLPAQPSAGERLIAGALHPVHSLVDLTKSIIPYSRHETPALSGETGPASVDKTRKLGFMSKLKRLDFFAIPCGSAFSLLRSKFKRQTAKAFRSKPVPQLMEPDDDDDNRYSGALIATMPTATDCKPQARTSDLAQHIHNNFGSITWNVFVKDVESARVYVQECYRYGFLHLFKRCEDVPEEMSVCKSIE